MASDQMPWAKLMFAGFGIMHLDSEQFWKLTPKELSAALGAGLKPDRNDPEAMDRLRKLMEKHLDI